MTKSLCAISVSVRLTPYRQPYTDPAHVLNVHGNKCKLRLQDGRVLRDVHLEDVLKVPDNARNLEKDPLVFEDDDSLDFTSDPKRSPGMMIEDRGQRLRELTDVQEEVAKNRRMNPGRWKS